ncbi:MAG: molybdopterin-guanine dinucleotide biosynthesis protein MobA [Aeromicrobium sp.]|uniref:molybdenum cofactor guanylyltransferase n=1 Tax=Aeromicrobium sp. TaxID=1871063 RepID=UPI002602FDF5|nr:NTP transferase domain-containing protein [Aeromicrobium sp.]MCW2823613.1 molybdopterin-guanine dinucleotide biosynthesis protein MobA [Aeromicrobium sp.]
MLSWDAIVLAGGRGSRLGGVDKAGLVIGGTSLLERTLDAVRGADRVVVVGDVVAPDAVVVQETPRHGGPAAAVGAGLAEVTAPYVLLLGCDQPFVAEAIDTLVAAATGHGVVAVDADGRRQHLMSVVDVAALRASAAALGDLDGQSLRNLLRPLDLREVVVPARSALDVDTWDDHERARAEEERDG